MLKDKRGIEFYRGLVLFGLNTNAMIKDCKIDGQKVITSISTLK